MSETISYLEITDPADLSEPAEPLGISFEIKRASDPALNRGLYAEIGRPHGWVDRLKWSEETWRGYLADVETWIAIVDGDPAAYAELKPQAGSTLIAIFGVRKPYRGQGIGGALLAHSIRRGFELGSRVWLSTNSMDSDHALAHYEARGMRVYKRKPLR